MADTCINTASPYFNMFNSLTDTLRVLKIRVLTKCKIISLASCPWGPVTAHGVGTRTPFVKKKKLRTEPL